MGTPHRPASFERERVALINHSAFQATSFTWCPKPETWRHTVVVKGTFALGEASALMEEQAPVCGDVLSRTVHEDLRVPPAVIYSTDLAPYKPKADVFVVAHAYAPKGDILSVVTFTVGEITKQLVAFGPRSWRPDGLPSAPSPFERVSIDHEHACHSSDNPVGTRHAPPRIEWADALIRRRGDDARPACMLPLAPNWPGRTQLLGAIDADEMRRRWPALPSRINLAYFNAAPPDQQHAYFEGGEAIVVTNVRPGAQPCVGTIPRVRPLCSVLRDSATTSVKLVVDTVNINCNDNVLTLVWRGVVEVVDEDASDVVAICVEDAPFEPGETWLRWTEHRDKRFVAPPTRQPEHEAWTTPDLTPPRTIAPMTPRPPALVTREKIRRWLADDTLAGRDLTGADLSELDFSGCNMQGTILGGATLDGCCFDGANLREANLQYASGKQTSWRRAELVRSDLAFTFLPAANFENASLEHASAGHAQWPSAKLRGASCTHLQLPHANLAHASFYGANLESADLSYAVMDGARFAHANLDGAKLFEIRGDDVVFDEASLVRTQLEKAVLHRLSARRIRATGSRWEDTQLPEASFARSDLRQAGLKRADLTGANLTAVDFTEATLERSVLIRSVMCGAKLMRAVLDRADLDAADMRGCNLFGCSLQGTQMPDAVQS